MHISRFYCLHIVVQCWRGRRCHGWGVGVLSGPEGIGMLNAGLNILLRNTSVSTAKPVPVLEEL